MESLKILDGPPESEVVTVRTFEVSQALAFEAWTNPVHLKNWWGPNGFTNTFHVFDLKPGGKWSFIMHGPDGKDYPNESTFILIDSPSRLVFNHDSNPKFQVEATFDVVKPTTTKVTFRMKFNTVEECNKLRAFVTDKNEENFDRLGAEMEVMKQSNF